MTSKEQAHPTAEALTAFAQGRLEDDEAVAIADHLDVCKRCQKEVLATPNDPLLALLCSGSSTPVPHPDLLALTVAFEDADTPPELGNHPRYRLLQRLGQGAWAKSTRRNIG